MKKRRLYILICLCIWLVTLYALYHQPRIFSAKENRYLTTFKMPQLYEVTTSKWQDDFEIALKDQIPLRDSAVSVKTNLDKLLGRKDNGRVYFGKDHYLFAFETYDEEVLMNNLNFIAHLADKTTIDLLPVYSSLTILEEKRPPLVVSQQLEIMKQIKDYLPSAIQIIDTYDAFRENSDEYIYYRNDHHWTTQGAKLAYEYYMSTIGITPLDYQLDKVSDNFYGTSYHQGPLAFQPYDEIYALPHQNTKLLYEDGRITNSYYQTKSLNKVDQYRYFLGGNDGRVDIQTQTHNGQSLLIIKDSYANCFIPFLDAHYENITVIDPRYFTHDLTTLSYDDYDRCLILIGINQLTNETISKRQ